MQEYGDPMAALLEAANPPGAAGPADEPAILWALAQKELNANNAAGAQPYLDKLLRSTRTRPAGRDGARAARPKQDLRRRASSKAGRGT